MKMIKVLIPTNLDAHFAKYCFENGVKVLLSYAQDFFFDGVKIVAFVAVEAEKVEAFTTEFKNHIKG